MREKPHLVGTNNRKTKIIRILMLAYSGTTTRSLLRSDYLLLNFLNSCVKSKPLTYFRGHCSYRDFSFNKIVMSGVKEGGLGGGVRNKKQKAVSDVWRAVSTQATSSAEDYSIKDVTIESEDEVQFHEVIKVAEAATEVTDSTRPLEDKIDRDTSKGVVELSAEKHSLSLTVGASLFRFVKGHGGSTQQKIEEEMGVKIVFPPSKKEESIIIEGISVDSVTRASEMIQAIVDKAVNSRSLDYSHFVSLPLAVHPQLVHKLMNFQKAILENSDASLHESLDSDSDEDASKNEDKDQQSNKRLDVEVELKVEDEEHTKVTEIPFVSYAPNASRSSSPADMRIDKSIFLDPRRFHLTVLMLKLWNKERVDAASQVLKNVSSKVIDALDNRPICIRLKGLDCMRGSLAKCRVLYAPVEEIGSEGRLLRACQVIIDAFVEAGLVIDGDVNQRLKLHATLMNTRQRKWKGKKGRGRKFDWFDARGIFEQFGNEKWGDYLIREAHLSQRLVYDENGYYHRCASIPFPDSMQLE